MDFSKEIMKVANSLKVSSNGEDDTIAVSSGNKNYGGIRIIVRESLGGFFDENELKSKMNNVDKRLSVYLKKTHNILSNYGVLSNYGAYGSTVDGTNDFFISESKLYRYAVAKVVEYDLNFIDCKDLNSCIDELEKLI